MFLSSFYRPARHLLLRCKRPAVQVVRDTSLRSRENMERTTEAAQNALGHLVNSFSVPPLSCIIIIITTRALQRKERERERECGCCVNMPGPTGFSGPGKFSIMNSSRLERFLFISLSPCPHLLLFRPSLSLQGQRSIDAKCFRGKRLI